MGLRPRPSGRRFLGGATLLLAALALVTVATPASAVRLASYNLLNYDNQYAARDAAFRTVVSGIGDIDILAVQEVQDHTAINRFKTNVLDVIEPGQWATATFYNDPSMSFNQGLYYRSTTITVVQADTLGNYPRDIAWYRLRPIGYSSAEAEIVVFVTHFKAATGSTNEATRHEEAERLRLFMNTNFPAGTNMVVLGDFNMYTSSEAAYQEMIQSQANNIGRVHDPINTPGSWNNSYTYRFVHTQSTRTTYPDPNDGGATGGMDDRFDQILTTYSLADGEKLDQLAGTYTAYGQDGLHYNLSINAPPTNAAVGQTIADALYRASDHLPVYMDFQVPAVVSADASLNFDTVIIGAVAQQTLTVANAASAPADELDYSLAAPSGFGAPGGTFQVVAGAAGNNHTVTMLTSTEGAKAGNLVVNSDDVDDPAQNVALSGTVLRHASPSLSEVAALPADTLDFGIWEEGEFVPGNATVANLGHDALQALLNVYDAVISGGDGRFDFTSAFAPVDVGGTPADFELAFDDTDAAGPSDTTYTATLTFSTRDDEGVPGATDLDDLVLYLKATVKAGNQVGVGDRTPAGITLLRVNYPNPFRAATRIRFELAEDAHVVLTIFDIQGRIVNTLASGWMPAGQHDFAWDGATGDGRSVSPGVYFYRLDAPGYTATRRMIKLR